MMTERMNRVTVCYNGTGHNFGKLAILVGQTDRCNSDGTGTAVLRVSDKRLYRLLAKLQRHPAVESYHRHAE